MARDYFLFAVFLTGVTALVLALGSVAAGLAVAVAVVVPAAPLARRALRPLRPFSAVAVVAGVQQPALPSCAVAVVLPLQQDFEQDFFTSVFVVSAGFFSVVV